MEHLPLEILHLVLREAIPPIYNSDLNKRWLMAVWQKKSLLQVCKSWYWVGIPMLYESIVVHHIYQLPLLLQSIQNSSGDLAGYIREITLSFAIKPPMQYLFEDHIHRLFSISPNLSGLSFPKAESPFPTVQITQSFITRIILKQPLPYDTLEEILTLCSGRLISLSVYLPEPSPSDPLETKMELGCLEELICNLDDIADLSCLVDRDWILPRLRNLTFQLEFEHLHNLQLDYWNPMKEFCKQYGHGVDRLCITYTDPERSREAFSQEICKLDLGNLPSLKTLVTHPHLSRTGTFSHPLVKSIHTWSLSPSNSTSPSIKEFYTEHWNAETISETRERFPALTNIFEWSSSSGFPGNLQFEHKPWSETLLFTHKSPGFTIVAAELTESPLDCGVLDRRDIEDRVTHKTTTYGQIPVPQPDRENRRINLPSVPNQILRSIFEWAIPPPFLLDALTHPLVLNSLQFRVVAQKKAIVNVCTSWNRVGIPLFYQHVCITRPHQLGMLLQALETASRPLKQLIKMLLISSYIPDMLRKEFHTQLGQILSVCPNLRSFSYAPPLGHSTLPIPKFIPNGLPPLTQFKFRFNCEIPPSTLESILIQLASSLVSLFLFIPTGLCVHRPAISFNRLRELTLYFNSAQDMSCLVNCNWSFPVLRCLTLSDTYPAESAVPLDQYNCSHTNDIRPLVWFCKMHTHTLRELRLYPPLFFWQCDLQSVITVLTSLEKLVFPDKQLAQGLMHPNVQKIDLFQQLGFLYTVRYGLISTRGEVAEYARLLKLNFPLLKTLRIFRPIGILPVEMLDHIPPDDIVIPNPCISDRFVDLDIVVSDWFRWPSTQMDFLHQPFEDEEPHGENTGLGSDREGDEEDSDSTYVTVSSEEESEWDVSSGDEGLDPLGDF